jgi:hypothetical protein
MSDITYFPTNSTKRWNKRMIEKVQELPERFFTETVEVTNKITGKSETIQRKVKLSGRRITKLVTSRYKLEKWNGSRSSVLSGNSDDYDSGGVVKIKKEKKLVE